MSTEPGPKSSVTIVTDAQSRHREFNRAIRSTDGQRFNKQGSIAKIQYLFYPLPAYIRYPAGWQTARLIASLRSTSRSRSSRRCQTIGLTTVYRIHYSDRYSDDHYEYRHVILPKPLLKLIPKELFDEKEGTLRLLTEAEWRGIGITQSLGWQHYEVHGLT